MNTITFTTRKILSGSLNKALLGMIAGLFLVYSFLIGSTVVSINERKDLYSEIRAKQARLSELEIQYFNLAQGIDMNRAKELGFVDGATTFAYTNAGAKDAVALR